MGQIVNYVRDFVGERRRPAYWILIGLFAAATLALNYGLGLWQEVRAAVIHTPFALPVYFAFYVIPFGFGLLCNRLLLPNDGHDGGHPSRDSDSNPARPLQKWLCFLIVPASLACVSGINVAPAEVYTPVSHFRGLLLNYAIACLSLSLLPLAWWWLVDRHKQALYGTRGRIRKTPYFVLLGIVAPFVAAASFGKSFLTMYPRFHDTAVAEEWSVPVILPFIIFELVYGLNFIFVEFFFRGFGILALGRFVGSGAVVPSALAYLFVHFSKPFPEAAASLFGGVILGVIAWRTKSITGGVIVHLGIAWVMEAAAHAQYFRLNLY